VTASETRLRLLGKTSSINVRKVLWTCAEIGLEVDREDWGSGFRPTDDPAFLALNPNAMVPVIVDDGFVLWESNSICRYLATKHGRDDLLPTTARARAQVEQWMDWQAGELNNAWRYAFMALVRQSPAHRDASAVATSVALWNRHVEMLDRHLAASGPFVAGERFTLADVVLGVSVNRWLGTPLPHRPEVPAVSRWFETTLADRPGFAAHCRNGTP
jgi:glutathione S-transferase